MKVGIKRMRRAIQHLMGKRVVAMALALSLILMTAMSACGRAEVEEASDTPNTTSIEASPSPEETQAVVPESEHQESTAASESPSAESEVPAASAPPERVSDFTFELIEEAYEENGYYVFFPQLVSESDPVKADLVNDIIQEDLKAYLAGMRETEADVGNISLELSWTSESMANNALTIAYSGISNVEDALYPQHVYRTVVINLVEPASLTLSEVFDVGVAFAEQFRTGIYAPLRDELDLEASGADIPGIIDSLGSMDQLVQLLREPSTPFVLALQGVIVSVRVPHAVGDHLEMAIPYEAIESLMKRNTCSVWTGYQTMSETEGVQPAMSAFPMLQYRNARFGYTLSYPDIFEAPMESENGDGITLVSADGTVTLLIWGQYNLEPVNGAGLLVQEEQWISGIESDWSIERLYGVIYDGGDENDIRFSQRGYAGEVASVHFRMSFPRSDEEAYSDVIEEMTTMLYVE